MKLLFTGDFCPAGIDFKEFSVDEKLLDLLDSADAVIGNLECPFTRASASQSGQFINLRAEPENNLLVERFTAFSIANNHILDYGFEGAGETVSFLSRNGISSFGFGTNPKEAAEPLRMQIGDMQCAFFGITQWYSGGSNRPGTCSDRSRHLFRNIKKCSKNGDFVVVMPHWNYEFADYPAPAVRRLAEKLVSHGTDLVVGAHPHVINGTESLRGKTVAYSLGNFLFSPSVISIPESKDPRLWESLLLECSLIPGTNEYSLQFHPVHFSKSSLQLSKGHRRDRILARFNKLNTLFATGKAVKKAFYSQSPLIINRVSSNMKSIQDMHGFRAIARRLHRVRVQDILVGLHAHAFRKKEHPNDGLENTL